MENNLKNRYIYAVIRHLPLKMQADVEKELDSLVSEMVEERRGNKAPNEQDVKDVLNELGAPEELALKYYGSERNALISGTYFLIYKRVLRIVLPIVAAVLAILTTVTFLFGGEAALGISVNIGNVGMSYIAELIGTTIGGVIQAFAVITIVFAVLDYMKVNLKDIEQELFDLPEIPEAKMQISPYGPIWGIVLSVSLTALLLGFPQVISWRSEFEWIPIFDTQIIRGLWFPILFWMVIEIIAEIVKLVEGHYTMRLATITVITSIIQVVCAIAVFGSSEILNPEFISFMENNNMGFEGFEWAFNNIIMLPNTMFLAVTLIVLFFETLDVVVKAFQSRRS